MSYFVKIRAELLALRAGTIRFDQIVRVAEELLRRRARMYTRRWGGTQDGFARAPVVAQEESTKRAVSSPWAQDLLDEDDLLQIMRLAMWRAVETWDPDRGTSIDDYVDVQVQQSTRAALRKAAGYPDPRRSPPLRRATVDDLEHHAPSADAEQDAHRAAHAIAERFPDGVAHSVVVLLMDGYEVPQVAAAIYADPDLKVRYRLDSERAAATAVRAAVREIREEMRSAQIREEMRTRTMLSA